MTCAYQLRARPARSTMIGVAVYPGRSLIAKWLREVMQWQGDGWS
jgi:hypothetical protein